MESVWGLVGLLLLLASCCARTLRQRCELVVCEEQFHQVCEPHKAAWQCSKLVALEAQPREAGEAVKGLRQRVQLVAPGVEHLRPWCTAHEQQPGVDMCSWGEGLEAAM